MTETLIKPTNEADIPGLRIVLDQTGLFPSEMLPDMLAPTLADESEAFWLTCHHQGTPVGFCYTEPEQLADGTWNMLALAVLPAAQGAGVGKALVAAAEAQLKDQNQRVLIVETSGTEDFTQARGFYSSAGYEKEAVIRDFWAAGDDKVIFRKAL